MPNTKPHLLSNYASLKVGILSDTHGHLDQNIADEIHKCDIAIHAGDVGAAGVLDNLQPRLKLVFAVKGNNDLPQKWPQSDLNELDQLNSELVIELPGGILVVVHGHHHTPAKQRHQILREAWPTARAIVYGHSHKRIIDDMQMPWVLNPGAAGMARTFGGPSCLILTTTKACWQIEERRFLPRK